MLRSQTEEQIVRLDITVNTFERDSYILLTRGEQTLIYLKMISPHSPAPFITFKRAIREYNKNTLIAALK